LSNNNVYFKKVKIQSNIIRFCIQNVLTNEIAHLKNKCKYSKELLQLKNLFMEFNAFQIELRNLIFGQQ